MKSIATALGVVASLITIVVFITGHSSVKDLFSPEIVPEVDRVLDSENFGPDAAASPLAKDMFIVTVLKGVASMVALIVGLLLSLFTMVADLGIMLKNGIGLPPPGGVELTPVLTSGLWHIVWDQVFIEWYWNAGHWYAHVALFGFMGFIFILPLSAIFWNLASSETD